MGIHGYADKTSELYIQLYLWHPTPATMHTIFMYVSHYIRIYVPIPIYVAIGQLSEEAPEARNKHFCIF